MQWIQPWSLSLMLFSSVNMPTGTEQINRKYLSSWRRIKQIVSIAFLYTIRRLLQSHAGMGEILKPFLIARFMGPTWGPSGADRTQVGSMLAPWTLLFGIRPWDILKYVFMINTNRRVSLWIWADYTKYTDICSAAYHSGLVVDTGWLAFCR